MGRHRDFEEVSNCEHKAMIEVIQSILWLEEPDAGHPDGTWNADKKWPVGTLTQIAAVLEGYGLKPLAPGEEDEGWYDPEDLEDEDDNDDDDEAEWTDEDRTEFGKLVAELKEGRRYKPPLNDERSPTTV
jgi:hypothetical protein